MTTPAMRRKFQMPCRRTDQAASFASEPLRSAFQFHGNSTCS